MTTTAPAASITLTLTGRKETAVLNALLLYVDALKKTAKREDALGLSSRDAHIQLRAAEQLLADLGWAPAAKPAEETGDLFDDGT
jgi:hypothetical protein